MDAGLHAVQLSGRFPPDPCDPVMDLPQEDSRDSGAGSTSPESQHFWVSGGAPSEGGLRGISADDALCNGCNGSRLQCCLVAGGSPLATLEDKLATRRFYSSSTPAGSLRRGRAYSYSGRRSGWAQHVQYYPVVFCFGFFLGPAARLTFDLRLDSGFLTHSLLKDSWMDCQHARTVGRNKGTSILWSP